MWGFGGIGHSATQEGLPFHGEAAKIDDTYLTGKLSVGVHPFVEHFKFVKALEDENTVAKQTIPAPAQFLEQLIMPMNLPDTRKFYPTDEELIADLVAGYKKVIADLYAAGCRNLQLDDCTWAALWIPRRRFSSAPTRPACKNCRRSSCWSTTWPSKTSRRTSSSTPTSAGATSTPPGPAAAGMTASPTRSSAGKR